MRLSVNDTVKNPVQVDSNDFLADLYKTEPETRTVKAIFVRDLTSEEQGYTKQVNTSDDPEAIIILDGSFTKYRLVELKKA